MALSMAKLRQRFHENIYMHLKLSEDMPLLSLMGMATVGNGLVPAITSILTGRVFDLLKKFAEAGDNADIWHHELTLRSMSVLALGAAAFPVMWTSISSWMTIGERQGFRVRSKLLNSYMKKPMEWYDNQQNLSGDFVQVNRCVEELRSSSAEASAITFQNGVAIIALICVSFYYSWSLTLIILCSTPVIVFLAVVYSRLIQKFAAKENSESSLAADLISWCMNSAQMVKLCCTQQEEVNKFENSVNKCNTYFVKMSLFVAANTSSLRFLTLAMFVQAFWFGSTMIRKGKLQISDVITCFYSCLMLGSIVNATLHQIVFLQKGEVALRKIQKLYKSSSNTNDVTSNYSIESLAGSDIELTNITFAYPTRPNDAVLKNVTIRFENGATTFIIGKSGSGKSTISNLLLKFYEQYTGTIRVGFDDVHDISQDYLLKNITIVEQRCTLFNDTLENNILLGCYNNSDDNIKKEAFEKACSMACLAPVINSLSQGLQTKLGTGGVQLSGGQQQRVALARAFMRDTDVLILDEAVSALDIKTREEVMDNIRLWRKGRTTVILTHDLSQIKEDDMLYVVQDGEVKESGFQKHLKDNTEGTFHSMLEHQQNTDSTSDGITGKIAFSEKLDYEVRTPVQEYVENGKFDYKEVESLSDSIFSDKTKVSATVAVEEKDLESQTDINTPKIVPIKTIIKCMLKGCTNKKLLIFGLFCSLIAGVTNPLFSWSFSYLLNGIVPSINDVGSPSYLIKWSCIVLAISAADGISNFLRSFILSYCSEYWIMDIRNKVMRSVIHKKIDWYSNENNKSSEISALVMNDLRDLRSLVSEFLSVATTFCIVSMMGLIWALASGWKLSLVCISMFPLIIIFSMIYGTTLQKYETEYKTAVANLENLQYEAVAGIKTVKSLQLERHFEVNYADLETVMKGIAKKRAVATGLGLAMMNTITMAIQSILYYYGLRLVMIGEYSTKELFQTFTLVLFTVTTCNSLISQIPDISRGQRAFSWLSRIVDEDESTLETNAPNLRSSQITSSGTPRDEHLIHIANLNFAYPSAPAVNIYDDLNLNISVGETVAIVGESGCGKSTLIQLLTALFTPKDNSIFIDGTQINDWDKEGLRRQMFVVEQKPTLFPGTIRENLLYGIQNQISEVDILHILKHTGIYDYIASLQDGMETVVDTSLLSGGQAQRLCIARALLHKPKILILDECTSALDSISANLITDIVAKGLPSLAIIVITHSKQMMKACNKIILMENGTVAQQGTYDELCKPGTPFQKLVT